MVDTQKIIDEVVLLIENKKLELAKSKTKEILASNPSSDVLFNILGVINLKLELYPQAIKNFNNAIKINNNFISAQINLGIAYQAISKIENAIEIYKKIITTNPQMYEIANDLGLMLKLKKDYKNAIVYFKMCLEVKPDYDKAYFNLGTTYLKINDYKKSLQNFFLTIKFNSKNLGSYFEIAEIYRIKKNFNKSLDYYNLSNHTKTQYKKLKCLFEQGSKTGYIKELNEIISINPNDRRIASLSAFASHQLKIDNKYPFCPDPLDFIYKTSLSKHINNYEKFIKLLKEDLFDLSFDWEPKGRTTVKGYATKELSEKKINNLKKLEKVVFKVLLEYFEYYKEKKVNFIKNKPKKFKFVSWSNILEKEGHNIPHIHPSGWVSGVFYLQMPNKIKNDEAGIQFHLEGDDFILSQKDCPKKSISPCVGDIVLFPSSLFHSTVPFSSYEKRVCIAFDLCDLEDN